MNAETESVECPACNWRGQRAALYQTKDGPVCPECIDDGGYITCHPVEVIPPSPPLSAKDGAIPSPLDSSDLLRKAGGFDGISAPATAIPSDGDANTRLCAAIADALMREDLTPEARTLVELALRAQRGETVDLRAEMGRRG